MHFSVCPVGPGAAEIIGFDCSQPFGDDVFNSLEQSFQDYPVLVFREQNLSACELAAFGRRFGPLDRYGDFPVIEPQTSPLNPTSEQNTPNQFVYISPDEANVAVITNKVWRDHHLIGVIDDAETWHADASYKHSPYKAIMLHAVSNPVSGGETEFCDLQVLYQALPKALKIALNGLHAHHHWSKCGNSRFAAALDRAAAVEHERVASLIPKMAQPVICAHPATGLPHLYLSPRFALRILDVPEQVSAELLRNLFALMENPRFVYRHAWRENDLVIWDNQRLNHRVRSYPADALRCRQRVTILGEPLRPYEGAQPREERVRSCS